MLCMDWARSGGQRGGRGARSPPEDTKTTRDSPCFDDAPRLRAGIRRDVRANVPKVLVAKLISYPSADLSPLCP